MRYANRFLIPLADIFKKVSAPHVVKYVLFLLLRGKYIPVRSKLKDSNSKIDLNLGEFIDFWIYVDGNYEGKWLKHIQQSCRNRTVFDVGSNIGVYSLNLYKIAKKIYAFEPEVKNFNQLTKNLKINSAKNVSALRLAISSSIGQKIPMNISSKDHGWHSLAISYGDGVQLVSTTTLDHFISSKKITEVGFIKIDVEGAELGVLKGADETLSRFHPVILIEFNKPRTELAGYKLDDLYLLLMKYRYQGYRLINNQLKQINQKDLGSIYNENVLFRHKSML